MRWKSLRLPRGLTCALAATGGARVHLWNWWWSDARDHGGWGDSGSDVYGRRRRDSAWTTGCSKATRCAQAKWCDRCELTAGTQCRGSFTEAECLADLGGRRGRQDRSWLSAALQSARSGWSRTAASGDSTLQLARMPVMVTGGR